MSLWKNWKLCSERLQYYWEYIECWSNVWKCENSSFFLDLMLSSHSVIVTRSFRCKYPICHFTHYCFLLGLVCQPSYGWLCSMDWTLWGLERKMGSNQLWPSTGLSVSARRYTCTHTCIYTVHAHTDIHKLSMWPARHKKLGVFNLGPQVNNMRNSNSLWTWAKIVITNWSIDLQYTSSCLDILCSVSAGPQMCNFMKFLWHKDKGQHSEEVDSCTVCDAWISTSLI